MDITVKGLKHPHRYVLDAAQTHIYMLMKKVGRLAESARKSSRLWVPGCGGRGHVWSRPEVLPFLGPRMRGRGRVWSRPGSPPVSGSPDAGEGGVCGRGLAAVGCRSVSCVFHLQQGWPLPVLPSPLAREEQLLRLKPSQGFSLCS